MKQKLMWILALGAAVLLGMGCADDKEENGGSDTKAPDGGADVSTPDDSGDGAGPGPGDDGGDLPDGGGDANGGTGALVINEVVAAALDNGPDWIELYNGTSNPIQLDGYIVRDSDDAHIFVFPEETTIAPGGFLVLYGSGGTGDLVFSYGLGADDAVRLSDTVGNYIDIADWADGDAPAGTSYGRYPDETGKFDTLTTPTPGAPNVAPEPGGDPDGGGTPSSPVVINEVVAVAADAAPDWVELYNTSDKAVSIGGWRVTDKPGSPLVDWATLPNNTSVPAKGFVVLYGKGAGGAVFDFGLGAGDDFTIAMADGTVVDKMEWSVGQAPTGRSFGRHPDGTGTPATLLEPTPGKANAKPVPFGGTEVAEGDVIIQEFMSAPVQVSDAEGEWIELYNKSGKQVDINGWTIADSSKAHIIDNGGPLTIAAGKTLVIGRLADKGANGGVDVAYAYGDEVPLGNTGDWIVLISHGRVIDGVHYDQTWGGLPGAALSLSPDAQDHEANDEPESWCSATEPYGDGDFGTPGAANPDCP